jgi:hypothetical protein
MLEYEESEERRLKMIELSNHGSITHIKKKYGFS